ncbi:MAG: triose-phosphate isomerase [Planctomycetes bacterium]|nr:triose-phosphate isomerase [Planctomycetota bacterium]
MVRKRFIAGNWKLNLTAAEGVALVQGLAKTLPTDGRSARAEVAVCPTALALSEVAKAAAGTAVGVGGQNCHWEEKGAFTGEVSASLLKAAGARYVIIGHSERRQFFGETDQTVNKRLKAALAQGLVPIVCVGETLPERDGGKLQEVLTRQVKGAIEGMQASQLESLVVAYEPVWAIGTGRTATSAQAQEAHAFIRGLLTQALGVLATRVRIQYGGSVKPDNAHELLSMPDVDGALVGGASLKLADFAAICAAAYSDTPAKAAP